MHKEARMKPPVGWFVVGYSAELSPRAVTQLRYFGEPLLMFRGADGNVVVLGADHWFFDGIPYSRKVPRAAVRTWPVCERNGLILVHFHPSRSAPSWEIPTLPEYNSPAWTPYVTRRWTMENDVQSVAVVQQRLRTRTRLDTPLGTVSGTLDIQSHGGGLSIVRFSGAVETLLLTSVTPIDDELVDARFIFTVKRLPNDDDTRVITERFVEALEHEVELDLRMHERVAEMPRGANDGPEPAHDGRARRFHV
jgi:hypothetical protein